MKKILLISYYYPPANFVGGQRTAAWAKYLREFGYYPIVITRQWNENQTDLVDKVENNELEVKYYDTHEVHRLPFKRSLRDRFSEYPILKYFQKALTFKELVLSNYRVKSLPFANFYTYCKELIENDSEIGVVIASGRPFQSFSIGHQLKKDYPRLIWLSDYRDKWTNNLSIVHPSILHKFIFSLEKKSEIKWNENVSSFITTSLTWRNEISDLISKPGLVVANGFDSELITSAIKQSKAEDRLNLLYLGTFYKSQNFSILFEAIKAVNASFDQPKVFLSFLGSCVTTDDYKDLENITETIQDVVSFIPKVPYEEVRSFIANSDLLILVEYQKNSGCIPVKTYDYYNSSKPILLCPSDEDLMEEFIKDTESGFIANSVEESKQILFDLLEKKMKGEQLIGPRNTENAYFYERRYQTKLLAKGIDELMR